MSRTFIAVMLIWLSGLTPLMAAERDGADSTPLKILGPIQRPAAVAPLEHRPAVLSALYGGFMALQVLDGYTTVEARARGAREANPMLGQGGAATVWAVKAATTASTVYFVERIWKKNRVAAILVMAGINSGYAAIAAHNARLAR